MAYDILEPKEFSEKYVRLASIRDVVKAAEHEHIDQCCVVDTLTYQPRVVAKVNGVWVVE